MAWKPGQSGNPRGRLSEKLFADAVRIAVNEEDPISGKRKLRRIAEKLVELALEGEAWAIQQVADRLDGKPAQSIDAQLSDADGAPLVPVINLIGRSEPLSAPETVDSAGDRRH